MSSRKGLATPLLVSFVMLALAYLAVAATRAEADAQAGQAIFEAKCAGCHSIGGGRGVGPDLKGVTQLRDRNWLARFILEPDKVIAEKDPIAVQLFKDYNNFPMPNMGLSAAEVASVIDYLASVSGQPPVTYGYDPASRLRSITQAPLNPVTLDYDPAGRRRRLTLPNGVSTEYDYDPAGRLKTLTYRTGTGALLGDLTYEYDANGNRTVIGGAFARTLFPDPIDTATYDAANRQRAFGAKAMTYDPNGSLTSLTDGGVTTTYTWDARNRLVGQTDPGQVVPTATFAYDARGRRATKRVNGALTQFLYDNAEVIQEQASGAPVGYLRGPSVDQPFVRNGADFYLADGLGSTLGLTNPGGDLATEYTYAPFGQSAARDLAGTNAFQFTARENDGTGLYYYRARYYSPQLHRFVSEDPLTSPRLHPNRYAYVGNNPVKFIDPLGLDRVDPFGLDEPYAFDDPEIVLTCLGCLRVLADPRVQKLIDQILRRIENLRNHLKPWDIAGAVRDLAGKPILNPQTGRPYEHLTEVRQAERGLVNAIERLKNVLGDPRLTDAQRAQVQRELGEVSKFLDSVEKVVPRQ